MRTCSTASPRHDERAAFRQLLKISGVGPKLALTILSGMSVAELSHAVAAQEVGRLTKIPGIGKKTAERLLLELRDKLPGAAAALLSAGAEPGASRSQRRSECAAGAGL